MPKLVVSGAQMMCSFGAAPSALTVLPAGQVMAGGMPAANIMDFKPNVNIAPFGACMSLANPQVAAATSAAAGVLTPQPCIPATVSPWAPGAAMTMVGNFPAVDQTCMCNCMWAGVITISNPGQPDVDVA